VLRATTASSFRILRRPRATTSWDASLSRWLPPPATSCRRRCCSPSDDRPTTCSERQLRTGRISRPAPRPPGRPAAVRRRWSVPVAAPGC
jgi:hypothetical protein